ncbi:hypothetical protein [Mycolicibacterium thermoresistibile]
MTLSDALAFATLLATQLAQEDAPRNTGPDFGKASPFGLIIVILLLLATFALVWSMNRQLKKVPESFDTPADTDTGAVVQPVADDGSAAGPDSVDGDVRREPGG